MNVVKPKVVEVLDELYPSSPRIEDEPLPIQPRQITVQRSILEPLKPDSRASNPDGLQLLHLGRKVPE